MSTDFPRTVEEIFDDFQKRRGGLLKALTEEVDDFYQQCDPERDNLCLYGHRDGSWNVDLPADEVPPELPEPCLGINFARDGMAKKDWLALVAVHSDAWLMAVSFFYGVKLDANGRMRLFKLINQFPTLFEVATGRANKSRTTSQTSLPNKRKRPESFGPHGGTTASGRPSESPFPSGRPIRHEDVSPILKGRQAELFWPDDKMWYLVEIASVNVRNKSAKIIYASGEHEELDLEEIIRDGHLALLP